MQINTHLLNLVRQILDAKAKDMSVIDNTTEVTRLELHAIKEIQIAHSVSHSQAELQLWQVLAFFTKKEY